MENTPIPPNLTALNRHGYTLKGAIIFLLTFLLLIPMIWVGSMISERQQRESEARNEISGKWGGPQTILGPVMTVPVEWTDGKTRSERALFFLPEDLKITGAMQPERRKRGIFEVAVYGSTLVLDGHFQRPDASSFVRSGETVRWDKAVLSIGIPDLRGLKDQVAVNWQGQDRLFEPGLPNQILGTSGISMAIPTSENGPEKADFSIKINLKGSENLFFVPVGKSTVVDLSAPWADPSFGGAFLPDERSVSASGFTAHWKVLHLNRNFPQSFASDAAAAPGFESSAFGASLFLPVDNYAKSDRSVKYAALFIGLTFLIVFFIEIRSKKRVHPFQYALIGLAMVIFYVLLVSISEQLDFNKAYGIAAAMTIGLSAWYARGLFGSSKMAFLVGGALSVLYGFLFTVLQLQDYALLIGSLGLFVILATVMHFSRKIDLEG